MGPNSFSGWARVPGNVPEYHGLKRKSQSAPPAESVWRGGEGSSTGPRCAHLPTHTDASVIETWIAPSRQ